MEWGICIILYIYILYYYVYIHEENSEKIKNHDAARGPRAGPQSVAPMMMSCSPTGCVILTLVGLWF